MPAAGAKFSKLTQTEQQLRESEERFKAFFHSAAVGAARADLETSRILEVNDTFCHITGYSRQELESMTPLDITHPDDLEMTAEYLARKKRDPHQAFEVDKRYIRKDGKTIWVHLAVSVATTASAAPHYIVVVSDITSRKQAEDHLEDLVVERTLELERKNAELRQLSARLLQIQDEERKRIARDLHDSTGQSLAILAMNLEQLRVKTENISPSLAATVSDTREIVDKIITELRTISYLLHPPLLDELGLASALRWYADGLAERSELKINLDLDNTLGRLPADLETALFRVVQECLTNIHRHAASPTATIGLRVSSGNIVLEVADTGTGMSPEKLAKTAAGGLPGVGLRGMRERIEGFNGKLEILSGKEGTTIKILIPLDSLQASA